VDLVLLQIFKQLRVADTANAVPNARWREIFQGFPNMQGICFNFCACRNGTSQNNYIKENANLFENLNAAYYELKTAQEQVIRAEKLASLGDIFVNDAFGTAHRAHASTEGVTHYLPSVAGFLLEKEMAFLGNVVENPEKPLVTILGGAKVSDKIKMIENMMDKVNCFLIGGGMAYTFLKAQGKPIGDSKLEEDKIGLAKGILDKARQKNIEIVLPVDNRVADKFDSAANIQDVGEDIPEGWIDIKYKGRKDKFLFPRHQ